VKKNQKTLRAGIRVRERESGGNVLGPRERTQKKRGQGGHLKTTGNIVLTCGEKRELAEGGGFLQNTTRGWNSPKEGGDA